MKAEEARKLTESFKPDGLLFILNKIEAAAKSYAFNIIIRESISYDVITELKKLGYNVEQDFSAKAPYVISW